MGKRISHRISAMFFTVQLMYQMKKMEITGMDSGLYELSNIDQKAIQDNSPNGGIIFCLYVDCLSVIKSFLI
jgi:hypothetical protein